MSNVLTVTGVRVAGPGTPVWPLNVRGKHGATLALVTHAVKGGDVQWHRSIYMAVCVISVCSFGAVGCRSPVEPPRVVVCIPSCAPLIVETGR